MYDFSSGFGVINNAFANIGKQNELAFKQRALADLGKDINAGNYAGAAQKAIASGDATLGVSLLGLGQKAQEKAAEAEWLRRNGNLAGVDAPPAAPAGGAPLARLGQGITPTRGVQVANSEEDVQRLEAEASGLTQAGQRSEPRGLRNNNPGNIETGRFAATVQGFEGSDGRFARYATPEQGIQAADKLLTSYAGRGLNTVAGIVNRWAPPTENNTGAYVAQVAKELGVDPNQPLDMARPEVRQRLIAAKIRVENGKQPYAEDVFQRALNPNWQSEVASFEGGGAQPVQVAQAPAQPGQPVADAPAPGAAQAQGFVIPGTSPQQTASISADRQVQNLLRAYETAPDKFKPSVKARLDLRIEELKQQRADEKLLSPEQEAQRIRMAQAGRTQITNVNEAQKLQSAEDKARVDINTKFIGKLADSGPQVAQRMADMDVLAAVVRDAPPGPTADVQVFFDRLGAGLGLSTGELATRSDAMKAIIQRLAPAQREEGSGSTSDIEFKGMLASFPSLATTAEGRQMILTTIARQNEITRMRIEVADQWTQGEIPATEARKKIAQIDRASIYASEDEKKLIRKLAGTAKGGDLGKDSGAMRREVGGKLYEQRGGQWYPVEAK